jgi:hypothetical protein
MIGDYEIIEYVNPYFPDRQMYKCAIGKECYHTDDYGKLVNWATDKIVNAEYYKELADFEAGVIERFMEDVKYKD